MVAVLTIVTVAAVVSIVVAFTTSQINSSTQDAVQATRAAQEETRTVAKCSFQFTAYRAQYSQASNSALVPVAGLPPYAGLTLPPPDEIKAHLADNCQKYLAPFIEAAKETP